jgi:gamma-glutamyltranspeptidase
VDAAIATALCQGVMNPSASGLGGGGFMLIRTAQGETMVIDAREVAPAAALETMFRGIFCAHARLRGTV